MATSRAIRAFRVGLAGLALLVTEGARTGPGLAGAESGRTDDRTVEGDLTVGGNWALGPSTASAGNLVKDGRLFLHDPGTENTFLGAGAGHRR